MKKIISVLCVLVLLVSALPLALPSVAATTPKLVAITFDDGPGSYTERLLDGLRDRGAKATFFLVGNRISSRMDTVRRMLREGHQIGNHSYSHPDLNSLSASGVQSELSRTRSLLVQAGGERRYCLRPPYGNHNANVRTYAGGPVILWSVDTLDWKSRNSTSVYNKIVNETRDGSIVLLHDIYSTSVDGALRAIDTLIARGYECVTVEELFRRRAVTLQSGGVYTCAYNKGITLPAADAPKKPTVSLSAVYGGQKVTLATATKDASIYYTLDGSIPTEKSKKYSAPFTLNTTSKLRAIAVGMGGKSEVLEKNITIEKSQAPTIAFANGKVTLTPAAGTKLYYTLSSQKPTDKSTAYTTSVTVTDRMNVLVRAKGKSDRLVQYSFTAYGDVLIDTPADAWYFESVGEAMERGILLGTGEMVFAPEVPMTRAMFVTALYRLSGAVVTTKASFADVPKKAWYANAVSWAKEAGIAAGMSETVFAPDSEITREQMCALLCRYLKTTALAPATTARGTFTDDVEISAWAKADVYELSNLGLISGMGHNRFAPQEKATRAQCARLFVSVDDLL